MLNTLKSACFACMWEVWPFGRVARGPYRGVTVSDPEFNFMPPEERAHKETVSCLPPGVTLNDLLRQEESAKILARAHALAEQVNDIEDRLSRFNPDAAPPSCRALMEAQVQKLTAVRHVFWGALISLAAGTIAVDDQTLQGLIDKQAGDVISLGEMEKLAIALKMDSSATWASDIERILLPGASSAPQTELRGGFSLSSLGPPVRDQPIPVYDDVEGSVELSQGASACVLYENVDEEITSESAALLEEAY